MGLARARLALEKCLESLSSDSQSIKQSADKKKAPAQSISQTWRLESNCQLGVVFVRTVVPDWWARILSFWQKFCWSLVIDIVTLWDSQVAAGPTSRSFTWLARSFFLSLPNGRMEYSLIESGLFCNYLFITHTTHRTARRARGSAVWCNLRKKACTALCSHTFELPCVP